MFNEYEKVKIKEFMSGVFGITVNGYFDEIVEKLLWSNAVQPTDHKHDVAGYMAVYCAFADAPEPAIATAEFRFNPDIRDSQGRDPAEFFSAGKALLKE